MFKIFPGEKLLIKVIDDLADFLPYLVDAYISDLRQDIFERFNKLHRND